LNVLCGGAAQNIQISDPSTLYWAATKEAQMDKKTVENWMQAYIRAWNSNEPGDIGSLFTGDALYHTGPFDEPWRGREAIVAGWLDRKDTPGSFNFRYQLLAAEDSLAVVRGWTRYLEPPREYSNIWLIRFDDQGFCSEFTEWWVKRK